MSKGRDKKRKLKKHSAASAKATIDAVTVSGIVRPYKLKPLTSHMLQRGLMATSIASSLMLAPLAYGAPEGGTVVHGDGTITHVDDVTTQIDQMSQNLVMEFDSFDISADESVLISQPNAAAWFVGNVVGGSPTAIFGNITANGRVALVNANGVIFGETASINAAGVFAAALGVESSEIMKGGEVSFNATAANGGYIINEGLISASVGGSVTLLGESVINSGVIKATLGQVTLATGSRAVVNFGPEQLIGIEVTEEVLQNNEGLAAAISNTGTLDAEGGTVMLTSSVSRSLFDHAINNEGVIKAKSARMEGGVIKLYGGGSSVLNTGTMDVSSDTGPAGSIEIVSDSAVRLGSGSQLLATSSADKGGSVHISGESINAETSTVIDASGELGGGDITLTAASALSVDRGASLIADAIAAGDGGSISLAADDVNFAGSASARGGAESGDGGTVTITARDKLDFTGDVDLSAPAGEAGDLVFNVDSVSIEEDDQIRAAALEAVQGNVNINATGVVEMADLGGQTLDLAGSLAITVAGNAISGAEGDAVGFVMVGADDTIRTNGSVTVDVTDGSVNANAIIDVAGKIETQPIPAPLPNSPLNPGNTVALTANQGRIRIRDGAVIDVSGDENSEAGSITLTATGYDETNESGTVYFHGAADASDSDGIGGSVKLLGDRVGLFDEATVDASGATGGGEILVGGNYLGQGDELNALSTFVDSGVTLRADAVDVGDGGTVIVWSDEYTNFNGTISVTGGANGGDGGFVETSGKDMLTVGSDAVVILTAFDGKGGQWLIDPSNIDIVAGAGVTGVTGGTPFSPTTTGTNTLGVDTLLTALTGSNTVTVTTNDGDIRLQTALDYDGVGDATLILSAENNIEINGLISDGMTSTTDSLNIQLIADSDTDGSGGVTLSAAVNTEGGSFQSSGVGFSNSSGAINTDGGDVTINQTGFVSAGVITAGAGNVSITTSDSIQTILGQDITGNDITLRATSVGSAITVNSTTSITGAGNVELIANTMNLLSSGGDLIGAAGTLTVRAEVDGTALIIGGAASDTTNTLALSVTDLAALDPSSSAIVFGSASVNGNVFVDGGAAVNIGAPLTIHGDNFIGFAAGSSLNVTGDLTLSLNGSLSDAAGDDTTVDISANNLTITGATTIGSSANNALNLSVSSLDGIWQRISNSGCKRTDVRFCQCRYQRSFDSCRRRCDDHWCR